MTAEFYCFPHSGGFSYQFRPLARALAPSSVRPVDYPGAAQDEHVPGGVRGFVREWLARHADVDFSRVYLYGQSLGGLVAFETAVQLEAREKPAAGVVIAAATPLSADGGPRMDFESCSDEELLNWSFGNVQGRTPSDAERAVFASLAARLRRDLGLYGQYVPSGQLDRTPALLLQGTRDRICPPQARQYWARRITRLSWEEIDGGHLFHMDTPDVTAAAVRRWAVA